MSVLLSKIESTHYELRCSICEQPACVIHNAIPFYLTEICVIIRGITHAKAINIKFSKHIYRFLEKNDIIGLHTFLIKKHLTEFGIDAYCPKCDSCYCSEHYHINSVIDDEGFYDYSEGCCPHMHERLLDD